MTGTGSKDNQSNKWNNKNGRQGKKKWCKNCKSMGHHNSNDCYALDKNKHNQPPWYKDRKNKEGCNANCPHGMCSLNPHQSQHQKNKGQQCNRWILPSAQSLQVSEGVGQIIMKHASHGHGSFQTQVHYNANIHKSWCNNGCSTKPNEDPNTGGNLKHHTPGQRKINELATIFQNIAQKLPQNEADKESTKIISNKEKLRAENHANKFNQQPQNQTKSMHRMTW